MTDQNDSQNLRYEQDPKGPIGQFFAPFAGYGVTLSSFFRPTVTEQYPFEGPFVEPRFHGRHQLNRYADGLEKCVGCELCAWACPADAIYVEAASNTPEEQYSPGERYGRVYQINYLRCIFCVTISSWLSIAALMTSMRRTSFWFRSQRECFSLRTRRWKALAMVTTTAARYRAPHKLRLIGYASIVQMIPPLQLPVPSMRRRVRHDLNELA